MQVLGTPSASTRSESDFVFELDSIGKTYSGIPVLSDVKLAIHGGEIHTLMGENGAGKSTLVKIISGVIEPSFGTMTIDGKPVSFRNPREAEEQGVIIMHQELSLIPEMSVAQNVVLGREPMKGGLFLDQKKARTIAQDALSRFGFTLDVDTKVKDLRVGEQQLVEITRALLMDARLLIMDEPTSALSQIEADILMEVIRDLAAQGVAILYISHRMDEVFEISDRITVLRDGLMIGTTMARDATPADLVEMMVGRRIEVEKIRRKTKPSDELALQVSGLNAEAQGRRVLSNVSFGLRRGEILGVGGLLGAGRTELLETIFGARGPVMEGEVQIDGHPVNLHNPAGGIEHGLALITEDRKSTGLILNHSISDNIILPQLHGLDQFGIGMGPFQTQQALTAIKRLRIAARGVDHVVGNLSGGNQQKVVLGKWLGMEPQILLLDEPTRGIDIGAKDEIYDLIGELADSGISVLLASSEIPELLAICDRVMVLCEGRISGILGPDEMNLDTIKQLAMQFE
ncbi:MULTISPECIES: sugar ABC transporter ATP-binding protein [Falsihalocynthiibacter]|uniref:sugar ABC transporter ATP-binding protein n=1 Tax=Falsihalocynthiibacter TaxID=2854182 RepID=UPI0030024076